MQLIVGGGGRPGRKAPAPRAWSARVVVIDRGHTQVHHLCLTDFPSERRQRAPDCRMHMQHATGYILQFRSDEPRGNRGQKDRAGGKDRAGSTQRSEK
jgi:hypothetical protein